MFSDYDLLLIDCFIVTDQQHFCFVMGIFEEIMYDGATKTHPPLKGDSSGSLENVKSKRHTVKSCVQTPLER